MKLRFDENLSPKSVLKIRDSYPGSLHIQDCGLQSAEDEDIWASARQHGYAILTKDADFEEATRYVIQRKPRLNLL